MDNCAIGMDRVQDETAEFDTVWILAQKRIPARSEINMIVENIFLTVSYFSSNVNT